jgi:hypothetical protein
MLTSGSTFISLFLLFVLFVSGLHITLILRTLADFVPTSLDYVSLERLVGARKRVLGDASQRVEATDGDYHHCWDMVSSQVITVGMCAHTS